MDDTAFQALKTQLTTYKAQNGSPYNPTASSPSAGSSGPVQFQEFTPQSSDSGDKPGFIQSVVQDVASPFAKMAVTGSKALEAAGGGAATALGAVTGNKTIEAVGKEATANAADKGPVDLGYLGKVAPLQGVKDAIGTGAEIGSYFVPGAGVLDASLGKGALEGAGAGALAGAGSEAQKKNSDAGSITTSGFVGSILGAAAGTIPALVKGAKDTVGAVKTILNPDAEDALTRAIKPGKNNVGFPTDLKTAIPEVADTLKLKGIDPGRMTIDDLNQAITDTKKRIWDQYEAQLSPNAHVTVDTKPIADAIRSTVTPRFEMLNPNAADNIKATADAYLAKKSITLGEAEDFLKEANGELHSYYAKNKVGQQVASTDPTVQHVVREAAALRDVLYSKLDELTGSKAGEIKKLYGSLTNVGNEVAGRAQVAARQAPASLQETIHTPLAVAKGIGSVARGDIIGAGESAAQIAMSRAMKEANSTDGLIRKAFSKVLTSAPK